MQLYLAPGTGTTCGLCGDNNGVIGDDFRNRRYYTIESNVGRFVSKKGYVAKLQISINYGQKPDGSKINCFSS